MLHTLTYPKHSVASVCFNADGNKLVSGGYDETLKVWSVGSSGTFECESTLTGHTGYVPALSGSACSQSRVFANYSAMRSYVLCVGFDPSGKKLVSGSGDNTVRIWDVTTGEPIGSPLAGHSYG